MKKSRPTKSKEDPPAYWVINEKNDVLLRLVFKKWFDWSRICTCYILLRMTIPFDISRTLYRTYLREVK